MKIFPLIGLCLLLAGIHTASGSPQSSAPTSLLAEHAEFTKNAYAKTRSASPSGLPRKPVPAVKCRPTPVGGNCCRQGTFGCSWDKGKFIRCGENAC